VWKVGLRVSANKIKSPALAVVSEHFCFKPRPNAGVYKLDEDVY
jgi:hypothetical protein